MRWDAKLVRSALGLCLMAGVLHAETPVPQATSGAAPLAAATPCAMPQTPPSPAPYKVINHAQPVDKGLWKGTWTDATPLDLIRITQDAQGNKKVLSFLADMAIDSDGATPNVLGLTRLREIKTDLAKQHPDWKRRQLDKAACSQLATEAKQQRKYYDCTKQDGTALEWDGKPLNADAIPYIVVPPAMQEVAGVQMGDLALVRFRNKTAYAVVGDSGPDFEAGEASMQAARLVGINPDPATGGTKGGTQEVEYIVLLGTHSQVRPRSSDDIQCMGQTAFEEARKAGLVD